MSRWKGLLWKEWIQARLGMAFLVLAAVLSIGVVPFLLQRYAFHEVPVMNIAFIVMGFWVLALSYMPVVSLLVSLQADMKRPDIWLHSPAPSYVLVGVKAVFAVLMTVASMLFLFTVLALANGLVHLFSGGTGLPEGVPIGWFMGFFAEVGTVSLFLGVMQMVLGFLFWTIYQWLKKFTKIGAVILTGMLVGATFYAFQKVARWGPYEKLAGYGEIPLTYTERLNRVNDWSLDFTGTIAASGVGLAAIEAILLAMLAIYIFNRKVAR